MLRVLTISALAAVLLASTRADAQAGRGSRAPAKGEQQSGEAASLTLFDEGAKAYREGRFQDAVQHLERAYALNPDPLLLYNLARAYEGLGADASALDAYGRYLEQSPRAKDREVVQKRIETLRGRLAERETLARQRDAERRRAEAALREKAEADARARDAAESARPRAIPWVVAGVGLVALGAGVAFGVASRDSRASAVASSAAGEATRNLDRARSFSTVANVAFVTGGAITAAGTFWGIWELASIKRGAKAAADERASIRLGARGFDVQGAF
jgi:tetratricopeptide (TPR) repeat protein